jgi:serine protease inhibitor
MNHRTSALALLVASLAVLASSCLFNNDPFVPPPPVPPPRELTVTERNLVNADNAFGFKLFREICGRDSGGNVFVSPLSVSMALGMVLNGASGATLDSMLATLEFGEMTLGEVDESYRSLIELITGLDPDVTSAIANSIWYREGLPVRTEFIDHERTYFNAEVAALDFANPDAADVINAWVSRNTNGKIPKIVDDIGAGIVMILINAMYFNGVWTTEFDPKMTHNEMFECGDGSLALCAMMRRSGTYLVFANEDFEAVDLPYGNGFFSMTIFLPRRGMSIDEAVGLFTQENWEAWLSEFREADGLLQLPRFKLTYDLTLNDMLTALGMGIAFDPARADFGGIADVAPERLFISAVKHKTFVDVNERGTEAAAVTSVEVGETAVPVMIRVDRPFLFVIQEHHSHAILFAGKVMAP